MHAHDRFLPEWFTRIQGRQITLPRFQRMEAWGHAEVGGLLSTVLRGLPSGAALILEVGDKEKFPSRIMVDAPTSGGKVTEQLLDGQQRLTALWRSLNNKYADRTYLIGFEDDPHVDGGRLPYVYGQARWPKNGRIYPLWVDNPQECWSRGCIPMHLLCPGDMQSTIDPWIDSTIASYADNDKFKAYKELAQLISDLRTNVREFNLPYLALPSTTPKDVALDVFIKMNTSSVKLSTYDIVVALVEDAAGESLHDLVAKLLLEVPRASAYADIPSLVLDVEALRQNRVPSQAGYQGLDFTAMISRWDTLVEGIKGLIGFLEDEKVFDSARLPSYTPLPVIAALWKYLPTNPDDLGNARHLIGKFLWRSFLTSRYEQSSASNSLRDFRAIKSILLGVEPEPVPLFNNNEYPLPTAEEIVRADWPKRRSILGRGLLAIQMKCGARDIADDATATAANVVQREYHHIFPDSKLQDADVSSEEIYRSVNCALITWRTNRTISNKDPILYLKERIDNSTLGQDDIERRLRTHLIPMKELSVGNYEGLSEEEIKQKWRDDYSRFMKTRSQLLAQAVQMVGNGDVLDLSQIFKPEDSEDTEQG